MEVKGNSGSVIPTSLVFAVNGERLELSNVDPSTTLLEFLRTHTRFKSVKLGCGEGGCGACVVLISKYDPVHDKVEDFTASSCLTLLCSIHGCSITTSEGIGNSKEGFHPIHEDLWDFMTNHPEPPSGFSKVTVAEAEKAIAGNLCRCTGYRPIADACKSFSADVDMEDLGFNSFWKKGDSKDLKLSRLPQYDHHYKNIRFPMFLKEIKHDVFIASEKHTWQRPTSLKELQSLLELNHANETRIKLIVSNTGFIRNTASVGGNLVMAQKNNFPSDIATILLAVLSMVHIMTGTQFEWIALEEFLERPPLGLESVLLSIKIPVLELNKSESSEPRSRFLFETYRASPRPLGNALPYLNAAFLVKVSSCKDSGGTMIDTCRLSFGAYRTKHAIRAKNVEEFLAGKLLSVSILYEAVKLLTATIVPNDENSKAAYYSSLAAAFIFQCFNPLIESPAGITNGNEYHPIGKPIGKSGAALNASGEAVFVDDIPSPPNCLHGAYIYSSKPLARVTGIKLSPEMQLVGVRDIISSKDIPGGGKTLDLRLYLVKLGSQYYFYLETQTALAVPDEDNCITVYCSSQCPESTHSTIARCLGIPENNVRVITRRVGGGFGGKGIKAITASSLTMFEEMIDINLSTNMALRLMHLHKFISSNPIKYCLGSGEPRGSQQYDPTSSPKSLGCMAYGSKGSQIKGGLHVDILEASKIHVWKSGKIEK
ncbi:Molybdopterin dehydrogenase, FAD-binding [Sesbania bispinosa]|nr:Molybdopterin dehydrogenase, FAD-binding [Sesbania bispinosa]